MSKIVKKVKKAVKSEPVVKKSSAVACEPCKATGLVSPEKLCQDCNGKGVVHK